MQQQAGNADGSGQVAANTSTSILSVNRTGSYGYDDLERLASVNYGDGESQSYGFDPMGNRLSKSDTVPNGNSTATTTTTTISTYDAANRLIGVSTGGTSTPVTFDADGNTLSDSSGRTFTWDAQNRMTSCAYQGVTTTFTYGADGLRRSMTSNGVTTNYCYDGTMLVREMQAATAGNLQAGQTIGELYPTCTYFQGARGPAYRRNDSTGNVRWYLYDGLGSVVGEVDPNGCVTSGGTYDVYGAPRAGTQSGTASSRQGFVGGLGHQTDVETGGLVYMQARYYDPDMGRFVSQDPGCNGLNWYAYANGNPANQVDPDGRDPKTAISGALWTVGYVLTVTAIIFAAFKTQQSMAAAAATATLAALAFGWSLTETGAKNYQIAGNIIAGLGVFDAVIYSLVVWAGAVEDTVGVGFAVIAVVATVAEGLADIGAMASIGSDAE